MDNEKRSSLTHCSHCGAPRESNRCSYCDTPYEKPKSLQLKRVPPRPVLVTEGYDPDDVPNSLEELNRRYGL